MIDLFDFYPEDIFKPLGCTKHRRSYWTLLTGIYQAFYSDDSDAVDSIVDKSIILKAIEDFLINGSILLDTSSDEIEDFSLNNVQTNASMVFNSLKKWGWFKVDKNGLKVGVYMPPRVGNLIEALTNSKLDMSEQLGSHVYIVRSLLQSVLSKKDMSFDEIKGVIGAAAKDARSISRLMNTLSAEMLVLYEKIGQVNALSEKANLFYEEFVTTPTFEALNSINSNNHPYRYKAEILQTIDQIEASESYEQIVDLWKVSGGSEDELNKLFLNLNSIRRIFDSASILKDRVDSNHGKLVKRFMDSVRYQRRYGRGVTVFEDAIKGLKSYDADIKIDAQLNYFESGFHQENFNLPKGKPAPIEVKASPKKTVSKEEKIRTELRRTFRKLFRIDSEKMLHYLGALFDETQSSYIKSTSIKIDDYYSYLCFANARRLCNQTNKLSSRFKRVLQYYDFRIESTILQNHDDVCNCRPFLIIKKD